MKTYQYHIVIFLLLFLSSCCVSTAQQITFNFNFDNAVQTVALLKSKQIDNEKIASFIKLPGTQAVIKKIRANDTMAMAAISNGIKGVFDNKDGNFQYQMIANRIKEWDDFVQLVILKQDSIKNVLSETFSPYLQKDKKYEFNVYFLMGGFSMGFTFGGSNVFYVGLHRYKYDLQSVILNCKHELFHNIQKMYSTTSLVSKKLEKAGNGYSNVHFLLRNIFSEGSATYIEDYASLKNKNTPSVRELKDQSEVNNYRIGSLNLLMNRTIVDAFYNPEKVNPNILYELLFDWNWNNPGYYVGELMTKALVEAKGKGALFEYLKKDVIYFVSDYIVLSSNKTMYPIQFSAEFAEVVEKIKKAIEGE